MARLTAQMMVRVGLVLLALSVWGRLLPMANRADVVADEFSIAVSLVLVLVATGYLLLTRDALVGERRRAVRLPSMSTQRNRGRR